MPAAWHAGILGHRGTLTALDRALEEGRLPRVLLFHGPSGVGKLTTAAALARRLMCRASGPPPCGECDDCRRIEASALRHPDIGILHPQTRKDEEEASSDRAAETPAAPPDLHALQEEARGNPSWKILARPARRRMADLHLTPSTGSHRILFILAAERLGEESGNALLKVLEEPPPHAAVFLLCENFPTLLPTLRSRCRAYRFSPLSRGEVGEFLRRTGANPETAMRLAALAGGRIGRALTLAGVWEPYRERRARLAALLAEVRRQATPAAALAAARELGESEEGPTEDLSILMEILRDTMIGEVGGPPESLTDSPPPVSLPGLSGAQAAALLIRVERTREDLRRFINPQLALDTLFLDLADPRALASFPD